MFFRVFTLLIALLIFGACGDEGELTETDLLAPAAPSLIENNCPPALYKNITRMRYIPSGSFTMGGAWETMHHKTPEWTAETEAYYIDTHEVTVGDFMFFVDTTGYTPEKVRFVDQFDAEKHGSELELYALPVRVAWHDAVAYATWVGKRLPTEIEWEKAARAGQLDVKPTGNIVIATLSNRSRVPWDDGFMLKHQFSVKPVGSYAPNAYGLFDMMGNSDEWCSDVWNTNAYLLLMNSMELNPTDCWLHGDGFFTKDQNIRVVRGGGVRHNVDMIKRYAGMLKEMDADKQADFLQSTIHVGERNALPAIFATGFRCVLSADKQQARSWKLCEKTEQNND